MDIENFKFNYNKIDYTANAWRIAKQAPNQKRLVIFSGYSPSNDFMPTEFLTSLNEETKVFEFGGHDPSNIGFIGMMWTGYVDHCKVKGLEV